MSERQAQARAEAERSVAGAYTSEQEQDLASAFMLGVRWADAHPQPRTITRAEFEDAFEARFMPDPVVGMNVLGFLRDLGIEVRDE